MLGVGLPLGKELGLGAVEGNELGDPLGKMLDDPLGVAVG